MKQDPTCKEHYFRPQLEIIRFDTRDPIVTSGGTSAGGWGGDCSDEAPCFGYSSGGMCSGYEDPGSGWGDDCPDDTSCFGYSGEGMCSGYGDPGCFPDEWNDNDCPDDYWEGSGGDSKTDRDTPKEINRGYFSCNYYAPPSRTN